jgi:hypothetical protein
VLFGKNDHVNTNDLHDAAILAMANRNYLSTAATEPATCVKHAYAIARSCHDVSHCLRSTNKPVDPVAIADLQTL